MKIWIEVELNWWWYNYIEISRLSNLSFDIFKNIWNLSIKMSREYYDNTIEYNFYPFEYTKDLVKEVSVYLENQINKYQFDINWYSPAFVWTHIHFFWDKRISKKKLLLWTMSFIIENIDSISDLWLYRLIKWHQIWGYWSHRNNHIWRNILNSRWYWVDIYKDTADKNKYVPVFNSRATPQWKPKSVELRIIPNDFLFNWKINDLLDEINNWKIFKRDNISYADFFNKLITKYNELIWNTRDSRENSDSYLEVESYWITYNIPNSLVDTLKIRSEKNILLLTDSYYFEFVKGLNNWMVTKVQYLWILNRMLILMWENIEPSIHINSTITTNRTIDDNYRFTSEMINNCIVQPFAVEISNNGEYSINDYTL